MNNHYFLLATVLGALPLLAPLATAQSDLPRQMPQTRLVFITGEVLKPGAYDVKENDTLSSALDLAGGPTKNAN